MIKTEKGTTCIKGTLSEVCTDLTIIIREFRKCLANNDFEEEVIEELIADAVTDSKMSNEEVREEIGKFLGELVKKIFGGVL